MANTNFLSPLIDSLYGTVELTFKMVLSLFGKEFIDFTRLFKNIKLQNKEEQYPQLIREKQEEYYKTYEFRIPIGLSIEDFINNKSKIIQLFNVAEGDIKFERLKNGNILLKVKSENIQKIDFDLEKHKSIGFKIPIGIELDTGNIRYIDLSEPSNAHCYLAGGTRCGKSNALRLITTQLIMKRKCDIQLDIINEKIVDLFEFQNCKNVINYTEDRDEAYPILLSAIEECERRYELFKLKKVKNIWDYRTKVRKMPIRFVIIEELSSYAEDKDFHVALKNIASRGAGAGIFLILTAQLPNKDVLPNLTKQNINIVIGGKCKDRIRSEIIVDGGELHLLRGKGHMKVFDCQEHGTEVQIFNIEDEIVEEICSKNS